MSSISVENNIGFVYSKDYSNGKHPVIVKLHGSVDDKIILPTWNKTIHPVVEGDWRTAYQVLSSANHIRIIGYSLPITDAYVRYLLKASIVDNDNLKSITVQCLDDDENTIRNKYSEFIKLPRAKYKFINQDILNYLTAVSSRVIDQGVFMD